MKDNPSMQVLGVIKENEKTNTTNQTKVLEKKINFKKKVLMIVI